MNSQHIKNLVILLKDTLPDMKFFLIDPNTMTEAEISITIQEAEECNNKFKDYLEEIFKQIHNDNIGSNIERYFEDAENYCGFSFYILAKLKTRIKKYFNSVE